MLVESSGIFFRKSVTQWLVLRNCSGSLVLYPFVVMLRGNYVLRPLLESAGSLRVLLPYTGLLVCMCNTPSPRLLIRQLMCYTPYKSGSAGSSCVLPVSGSTGSLHVIPPTWENWFTKSVTPLLELLVCRCNTTTWNCWFTRSGSAGSPRWRAGLLSVMPLTQKCWFTTCYLT